MDDEQWTALLRVSVKQEARSEKAGSASRSDDRPAMLGSYSVDSGLLRFTPRFPFDPGRQYEVTFNPSHLPGVSGRSLSTATTIVAVVSRPKANETPSTRVTQVYPSTDVVPENQLRLYVQFSAPMGRRGGLEYIHLLDEHGREVEDPFLPLDIEFWNVDRTRYTFFFDPGRVKQGILPRHQLGPSLVEGRRYTVVIDPDWLDAEGLPLQASFMRQFRVGPPDEHALDPRRWHITAPSPASREPLVVTFGEPLDHGLLLRALGVLDSRGGSVAGQAQVADAETRWTFTPQDPWPPGDYQLLALSILEDLAGNTIGRPFEVDQFKEVDRTAEPEKMTLPFRIGNRGNRGQSSF
jgi:hypothetical protein